MWMSKKEKIIKKVEKCYIQETDIKKIIIIHEGQLLDVTKDYTRTWIDLKKIPYKYEFRGDNFMGYLNPDRVVITK